MRRTRHNGSQEDRAVLLDKVYTVGQGKCLCRISHYSQSANSLFEALDLTRFVNGQVTVRLVYSVVRGQEFYLCEFPQLPES
jgi:hypothetical protein